MQILSFIMRIRPARLGRAVGYALGFRRRRVSLPAGFTMQLDPVSILGYQLITRGEYESVLTDFVIRIVRDDDVAIDIGAHEGYISLVAATAARVTVHSFEPHPQSAHILRQNIAENRLTTIHVHEMAVADRSVVALAFTETLHTGSAKLSQLADEPSTMSVAAISLDDFVAQNTFGRIRVVKVDCEGGELLVFRGATSMLERHVVEYFVVDYHQHIIGPDGCREIDGRLRQAGYVCTAVNGLWVYHLPAGLAELQKLGPTSSIGPIQGLD